MLVSLYDQVANVKNSQALSEEPCKLGFYIQARQTATVIHDKLLLNASKSWIITPEQSWNLNLENPATNPLVCFSRRAGKKSSQAWPGKKIPQLSAALQTKIGSGTHTKAVPDLGARRHERRIAVSAVWQRLDT